MDRNNASDASQNTVQAPADGDWPADLAEVLDLAVARFDVEWRLVAANARWRGRYGPVGGSLDEVATLMLSRGAVGEMEGGAANALCDAIRLYARDAEISLPDGTTVLLTASPLSSGGAIVTTRDLHRDRLSEEAALRLLSDGLASAEMGMLLWDAGLVIRLTNRAWGRNATPAAAGEPVVEVLTRLVALGLGRGGAAEATPAGMIAAMHRQPRQWVLAHPDGRSARLHTYPTQSGGVLATAHDTTQRRTVEERAQALLADAVESMEVGIVLFDESLRSSLINRALAKLCFDPNAPPTVGMTVAELAQLSLDQGILTLPKGVSREEMVSRLVDQVAFSMDEVALQLNDGRFIEAVSYRTRMGGYVGVVRDVTSRVVAEAAAEEASGRTRTIVDTLGEGVALYDADLQLLINNPAFRRLVMNDLPLSKPGDRLEDEVRAGVLAGTIPVPPGGEDAAIQWILDCITNHQVDVELPLGGGRTAEASNYGTPDGGYLIHMRDITRRKAAEQAAREADALLRLTIEASPTPILVSRRDDGRIFFKSAAFRALFGDIESTVHIFLDPEERRAFLDKLVREERVDEFSGRLRGASGPVDALMSARFIDFGGERLITTSFRDVTNFLAMRAELERQREAAHQAEKLSALGELLAGVSHELNNPLSIILAHAMMLEKETAGSPSHARAKKIGAAAERSGRIVRSFLSMARRRPARLEACDMNEIVTIAADITTYGIEASGTQVQLDLAHDLPPVAADADQIVQVVSNLLINAGHAVAGRGSEGRIHIRTSRDPRGATLIEVADNGPGVPHTIRGRVFEPFFTTKDVGSGTGIGLAFCHRVVTAHSGEIRIDEADGGGARFSISLPAAALTDRQSTAAAGARSGTVLVVDDEPEICDALVEMLKGEGYDATGVTSGEAALAVCAQRSFDVILSDVRMPGMGGEQFLKRLRTVAPDQAKRVGFVTGGAAADAFAPNTAEQGPPTIAKPLNQRDIASFVASLIKGA
ncbi:MAG: PAS-domain containing protein [Pseudomonadota bacterium]